MGDVVKIIGLALLYVQRFETAGEMVYEKAMENHIATVTRLNQPLGVTLTRRICPT